MNTNPNNSPTILAIRRLLEKKGKPIMAKQNNHVRKLVVEEWAKGLDDALSYARSSENTWNEYVSYAMQNPSILIEMRAGMEFIECGMQVYDFDADFTIALDDADWLSLLPDVIDKAPCNAFYLKLPGNARSEGTVVSIDKTTSDKAGILNPQTGEVTPFDAAGLHTVATSPNGGRVFKLDKGDCPDKLDGYDNTIIVDTPDNSRLVITRWAIPKSYAWMFDDTDTGVYPVSLCLNAVAYLCSANADVNRIYTPPKPAKDKRPNKAKDRKRSQCTWLEVGYHIGAEIRKYTYRKPTHAGDPDISVDDDEKRSVRPHMRRAHWHHYWTGPRDVPEERELIIKWIAPTFVGKKNEFDGKPTVHRVR